MYLDQLLAGLPYEIRGNDEIEITSLCCNTACVKQNSMFFCLKGEVDGHDFAKKAVYDGAICLVVSRWLDVNATQILVQDTRRFMSLVAKNFYNSACDGLKIVAIVGTNGKTSCSYILDAIFSCAGYSTGVIGTNGIVFNGKKYNSSLTTPDPIDLHFWLEKMYQSGVKVVFLEMSAHALHFDKHLGLTFACTLFTNFTQDHLDFFGSMQKYAKAKLKAFTHCTQNAVINGDDQLSSEILKIFPNAVTFGKSGDCTFKDVTLFDSGLKFSWTMLDEEFEQTSSLSGLFNVYNCLGCMVVARLFGISSQTIKEGVEKIDGIEGRNQTFTTVGGVRVVVDFAHTPDGIEYILRYLKETTKGSLFVVFGCGGNSDSFKRPLMGAIVCKYCDWATITNDNPRFEDPMSIAKDIQKGMNNRHDVILDRVEAIKSALKKAQKGDTVVLLGKGAESFQEVKGIKRPYSDLDTVCGLLYDAE
ncbi:MAG: UDP-N-acetylmuramoyl-L-alanyl-D-glutamate--2,6-diaminopimelate ligase [Clostridia bacterium]|nr:UDP-N-acetylmuramoyl-L-alanyl-D-glutamate--2,6-diaminopimelate ligase [Clostridia bacterium]